MKRTIYKLFALCGVALAAFACVEAEVPAGETQQEGEGVLRLSGVSVVEDVTERPSLSTRAVSPDDFDVTITRTRTGEVQTFKYGEMPAELTLKAGDYELYIESHEMPDVPQWDAVHYSTRRTFTIAKDMTTNLTDVVCKVTSILVSVRYTDEMVKALTEGEDGERVRVTIGGVYREYDRDEHRVGVFKAPVEENLLKWEFHGSLGEGMDMQQVAQAGSIPAVKAGQHRTLTFDILVDEMGKVVFPLTVSVECETVDVNVNVDLDEEVIVPFLPVEVVASEGWTLTAPDEPAIPNVIYLGANSSNVPEDITMTLNAKNGIEEATLKIVSLDGETPFAGLSLLYNDRYGNLSAGLNLLVDPVASGAAYINNSLGIKTGGDIVGQTEYVLDMTKLIRFIHYNLTTNSAPASTRLIVTLSGADDQGNSMTRVLTFELRKGDKPVVESILTATGSGIGERMEILGSNPAANPVKVDIVASAGIKGFEIDMESSNTQFDGALALMRPLNLLDESKYEDIATLGLPYGDGVRNQTELVFDITGFMSLITLFLDMEPGDMTADFHLKVTDNTDKVLEATIGLQIIDDRD
ncbi:MAG: DUF4493 domain-containing protein [Alistipes sp.]|jgi:hypothetical protein|nr:DUF4493 domain-containing protein [Alistipes sp.]